MYCSSCGQPVAENAIICTQCGCPTAKYHAEPEPVSAAAADGPVVASYVVGAFIPLIGWIMAIYWLVKGRVGHALGVGTLSLLMFFFWLGIMANMR